MTNKRSAPPMNVGISLLLVVFLILCLFTFSAIALTSAKDEYQNSLNRATRTSEYYAAVSQAEEKIAEMVGKNESFSIPINDYQSLEVAIEPNDTPGEAPYRITKWQTVSSKTWQGNGTVQVFAPQINLK